MQYADNRHNSIANSKTKFYPSIFCYLKKKLLKIFSFSFVMFKNNLSSLCRSAFIDSALLDQ